MREEPLPANPNCVSFATDAAALFGGRSWSDLQRLAARIGAPFHEECQLPTLIGFAWRVALDRKNERLSQGQLWFVFDGPATSAHLDLLEGLVQQSGLGFGQATVERAPATGAPAIYLFGGRPHVVWSVSEEQPSEPWLRELRFANGRVSPVQVPQSRAGDADRVPDLPPIIGVPAPYSESEREGERMRLAFAIRLVERIVQADGVVQEGEQKFLGNLFPPELLERLGLDDPHRVDEYFDEAVTALPIQLGHHDKLALVGLFFSACCSDGSLDPREMRVLKEGGEMLGLTREQVVKYLRRFW